MEKLAEEELNNWTNEKIKKRDILPVAHKRLWLFLSAHFELFY